MGRPLKYCTACQNCFYEISTIFFTLWEIWLPYDFVRSHWVVSSWHFDLKNCKEVKKSSRFKVIGPRQLCIMRLNIFWRWIIHTLYTPPSLPALEPYIRPEFFEKTPSKMEFYRYSWSLHDAIFGTGKMRIHLMPNSTSGRFGRNLQFHLVRIYSTSASEKKMYLIKIQLMRNSH